MPALRKISSRMIVLIAVWTMTAASADGKPLLLHFKAEWCGPCQTFNNDCRRSKTLLPWLKKTFRLQAAVDVDRHPQIVRDYGVTSVPAFIVIDEDGKELGRTLGYSGEHNLRQQLANALKTPEAEDDHDRHDERRSELQQLRAAQAAATRELSELRRQQALWTTEQQQSDRQLQTLEEQRNRLQSEVRELTHRLTLPQAAAFPTDSGSDAEPPETESVQPTAPLPAQSVSGKWWQVAERVGGAALMIAAPEFVIPGSLALSLVGFALHRMRRRKQRDGSSDSTFVVDGPARPGRHRIDTQIVNVESDSYQRAHEHARQQIVRRYPGSQEVLEAELSLTRQFLAGQV